MKIAAPAAQKFFLPLVYCIQRANFHDAGNFLSQFRQSPSKPGFPEAGAREFWRRCALFGLILGNFTIAQNVDGKIYACMEIFPISHTHSSTSLFPHHYGILLLIIHEIRTECSCFVRIFEKRFYFSSSTSPYFRAFAATVLWVMPRALPAALKLPHFSRAWAMMRFS